MSPFEIIVTIVGAAGGTGVIIVGLSAWLGKLWADRIADLRKLAGEIDLDLRVRRIDVYKEIWEATAMLPKWPRNHDVTYEQLLELSQTLRDWYFHRGGIYLSRSTHTKAYGPLQDALADVLKSKTTGPISEAHYDAIREKCSALRSALANDIESRREGPV